MHIERSTFNRLLQESYQAGSAAGFKLGFADATEKLNAKHEEDIADILDSARARYDEDRVSAFDLGYTSGIEDEREHQESVCERQIAVGVQVDLAPDDDSFFTPTAVDIPLPPTSEVGLQTSPSISFPVLPTPTTSLLLSPAPIFSVSIPTPTPSLSLKHSWADDAASLPITPLITAPRDFSSLRSETKPFGTLRHRNRRRSQTARRVSTLPIRFPLSNTNASIPLHPSPSSRRYPHLSPPRPHSYPPSFLPPALDWDRDPRLSELSRVLQSLGWCHSLSSRS